MEKLKQQIESLKELQAKMQFLVIQEDMKMLSQVKEENSFYKEIQEMLEQVFNSEKYE